MNRFFRQYLILILGKYKHRNRKGLKIKTEENLLSFLTTTEIIKSIPLNRILIETDGPFSNFKGRPISPNDLSQVYNEIGRKIGVNDLSELAFNNLKNLLLSQLNSS